MVGHEEVTVHVRSRNPNFARRAAGGWLQTGGSWRQALSFLDLPNCERRCSIRLVARIPSNNRNVFSLRRYANAMNVAMELGKGLCIHRSLFHTNRASCLPRSPTQCGHPRHGFFQNGFRGIFEISDENLIIPRFSAKTCSALKTR